MKQKYSADVEQSHSSADSIVLIITKVEDPEELDTRFSKFTPADNSDPLNSETLEKLQGAEEFLNLLNKVKEAAAATSAPVEEPRQTDSFSIRLFSFSSLDGVIEAAKLIAPAYHGANTLYKDESAETFILALAPVENKLNEFNKICNMLSEYGSPEKADASVLAFLEEHCTILISADAVCKLSAL